MSDQTSGGGFDETPVRKTPHAEFYVYFTIIFLAAMPLACIAWAIAFLKNGTLANKGPVARAWSQARIITPMIFSA